MNSQVLNLFIIDDNPMVLTDLRNYLQQRFGNDLVISTFQTGTAALEQVDENTRIVILDYHLENEDGNEILKSIKIRNPKTEVIMFTSNVEVSVAIESFREGASNYIIKGKGGMKKITSHVRQIITYPIRILVKEFGIHKYLALFLLTFLSLGIVVCTGLLYTN